MNIKILHNDCIRVGQWPISVDVTDMEYTGFRADVYTGTFSSGLIVQLREKGSEVALFILREINLPAYWQDSTLLWEKRIEPILKEENL